MSCMRKKWKHGVFEWALIRFYPAGGTASLRLKALNIIKCEKVELLFSIDNMSDSLNTGSQPSTSMKNDSFDCKEKEKTCGSMSLTMTQFCLLSVFDLQVLYT